MSWPSGLCNCGWTSAQIRARVAEVLEAMDIAHLQDRAPHRLSGGEKKRVALAVGAGARSGGAAAR